MQVFNTFYFEDFVFDVKTLEARFYYSFDKKVLFEEIICFDDPQFDIRASIDFEILENILFHLHIALGMSYYKAYPTSDLIVKSGKLDETQQIFWKNFYMNGLGEFFFTNKINPKELLNFKNDSDKIFKKHDFQVSHNYLVPVGGGKDSIVSIEILKNAKKTFNLFVFGKIDELKQNCSDISGVNILLIERQLSPLLFQLNNEGYYNGHVPITGIIAFVMQVVSYLYDYKYLVLSNEKSANFSNTTWEGIDINHQYSKSLEFEQDFDQYVQKYISSDVKYFSLLRGMYEAKITKLFSEYGKKYFGKFSSCNGNFRILGDKNPSKWCNNCPKCVFVFTLLHPYLHQDEILKIFGEDLYDNSNNEILFKELLGLTGMKPFECVGTDEEMIFSMYTSIQKYENKKRPYILNMFHKELGKDIKIGYIKKLENKLLKMYDEDIIPPEIKSNLNF